VKLLERECGSDETRQLRNPRRREPVRERLQPQFVWMRIVHALHQRTKLATTWSSTATQVKRAARRFARADERTQP